MKIIVIILLLAAIGLITYEFSRPKNSIVQDTQSFIDSLNQKRYDDSVKIDHQTKIRIAEKEAKR